MQYMCENLTQRTGMGWNFISSTSWPVSMFHTMKFWRGDDEAWIRYFESGEKLQSNLEELPGHENSPLNLCLITPSKASSKITWSRACSRMRRPLGENFRFVISGSFAGTSIELKGLSL
eukprot:CAMPEP_0170487624 /NCGR_PEP_ID=MMETSP0208-20121228/6396_1 /TAXON_ID=197538 /ORGANISM="Strombidium inclinatum, Strain S3" /LENGTH=118 /DNA_ID=CAMNT_0010761967 /DNA_START=22 /DNA_END=378 /DNA_ORIENTATION=-